MSESLEQTVSHVFGVPGYAVKPAPSVGGMILLRPDGSSVCLFEGSIPESAVKRVAEQDSKIQAMWRETCAYLLMDPGKYIDYRARLDGELATLRHLVHGGAVAEEFGRSGRGQLSRDSGKR